MPPEARWRSHAKPRPSERTQVKPQATRIVIAAWGLVQAAIVGFALGAVLLEFTP
jgi:hypothetical protein